MGKVGPEPEQDQTGLVKIDTINRISVSKLDFTVPLPDGSPRKVLDGFSFDFSGPGTYCITGENGRGKTSLLYLLLGLYPSAGKVTYNDMPIEKCNFGITYVQTRYRAAPNRASLQMRRFGTCWIISTPHFFTKHQHMNELPSLTTSIELLENRSLELSGGELRRVYLWSAISRNPSVLVLDEPTTGLDENKPSRTRFVCQKTTNKQLIIIVSHDNELANAAETIVSLDNASHRCANR